MEDGGGGGISDTIDLTWGRFDCNPNTTVVLAA